MNGLIRLVVFLLRSGWAWGGRVKARTWRIAEAVVTDDPGRLVSFPASSVEFPYSYRIDGELYTGLHEKPCFLSDAEYMGRFAKGRTMVIRVKPDAPEVSVVREQDQTHSV
jgi:hypothetical protein